MYEARSDASSRTAGTTSSGVPRRRSGYPRAAFSRASGLNNFAWSDAHIDSRHEARTHDVQGDPVLADLASYCFRHGDHTGLGPAVHGLSPLADPAGIGSDGDDATVSALDHRFEHGAHGVDEAPGVDRDLALPLTAWFFHKEPIDRPAGTVHEHVDAAERFHGELDGGRDGIHVGYVRLAGDDRSGRSLRLNPLGLLEVDVGDQDTRSLVCEPKTD